MTIGIFLFAFGIPVEILKLPRISLNQNSTILFATFFFALSLSSPSVAQSKSSYPFLFKEAATSSGLIANGG